MLQYLFNLTAIWLCSLLLFDIFLKNESYHRYNRLYLLFTMLMGAILPLWQWGATAVIYHTPVSQSLYNAAPVQKVITNTTVQATQIHSINLEQIITIIYLLGVGIALLLLIKDIVLLLSYYQKGHKSEDGKITIIETGKSHGPFSIFSYVFVNSRDQYTDTEWRVLLQHEARHNALLHIADLIILQVAKVIFWFHPLIYIYQKRLLLVHEYQADTQLSYEPKEYGKFLIEQALLQTAPTITHSFNRSPIKKRIAMLTRKSPRGHSVKLFIALPLTLCCVMCFTQSSYSFKRDGKNVVTFMGNKFVFDKDLSDVIVEPTSGSTSNSKTDTVTISSGNGNATNTSIVKQDDKTINIEAFGAPLTMNGDSIFTAENGMQLANPTDKEKTLTDYLFYSVSDELSQLPDGEYRIDVSYPIIDKKGKLVYYENQGVSLYYHMNVPINKDLEKRFNAAKSVKKKINTAITKAMDNAPALKPMVQDGKAVPSYDAWAFELQKTIVVSNHKVSMAEHALRSM